jgi:hypothetical protein
MIHHDHPIINQLNELKETFHPIGSRTYCNSRVSGFTDYDFLVAEDDWNGKNIGEKLEKLGFKKQETAGYCADSALLAIYRYPATNSLSHVDVLIAFEKEVKFRLKLYPQVPTQLYAALSNNTKAWADFIHFSKNYTI